MTLRCPSCEEVLACFDGYADRELDPEQTHRVELHLRHCRRCAEAWETFRGLHGGIREALVERCPSAPSRLMERLRALRAWHTSGRPCGAAGNEDDEDGEPGTGCRVLGFVRRRVG